MIKKLTVNDVYKKVNLDWFNSEFEKNKECIDVIEQDRAKEAIHFGLKMDKYGYNIFCSGNQAARKITYIKSQLNEIAKTKSAPDDICYVNNFNSPLHPILIMLPNGQGCLFKQAMRSFVSFIKKDIEAYFNSRVYKKSYNEFQLKYDDIYGDIIEEYSDKILKYNYTLVSEEEGLFANPCKNGKALTKEEFEALSEEETLSYFNNKKKVDTLLQELLNKFSKIDKDKKKELLVMDKNFISDHINKNVESIKKQFGNANKKISGFMDQVMDDIYLHIDLLKPHNQNPDDDTALLNNLLGLSVASEHFINKYLVNLVVDNKDLKCAPVVFLDDFQGDNLLGYISSYITANNTFSTDYSKIQKGSLMMANGGYLVIKLEDLFKDYYLWAKLKNALKRKEIRVSAYREREMLYIDNLIPDSIPLSVKVIIVGNYQAYSVLSEYDSEFSELFKVHAIFDNEADRTSYIEKEYALFIKNYCKENHIRTLSKDGYAALIEYSSRLAGSQKKLLLTYNNIYKLLDEADLYSGEQKKKKIDADCIYETIKKQRERIDIFNKSIDGSIKDGILIFNVEGSKVGEINGLSVIDVGDYMIGKPCRITCSTYVGNDGVISVDRNVKLSGNIHSKGVEIIRGYLGKTFAQKKSLGLCASISFEQMYSGIDGDSATSTELYAILSDLSGIPIKQSFAVTGSMNQKGEIQAIGGVNEKIEGFYDICKLKGFTGKQGVIIPSSNVSDLMLREDVREDIDKDLFTIYSVDSIKEGFEILTGVTFDKATEKIEEKLVTFHPKK